jgi:hypothetical protein
VKVVELSQPSLAFLLFRAIIAALPVPLPLLAHSRSHSVVYCWGWCFFFAVDDDEVLLGTEEMNQWFAERREGLVASPWHFLAVVSRDAMVSLSSTTSCERPPRLYWILYIVGLLLLWSLLSSFELEKEEVLIAVLLWPAIQPSPLLLLDLLLLDSAATDTKLPMQKSDDIGAVL